MHSCSLSWHSFLQSYDKVSINIAMYITQNVQKFLLISYFASSHKKPDHINSVVNHRLIKYGNNYSHLSKGGASQIALIFGLFF